MTNTDPFGDTKTSLFDRLFKRPARVPHIRTVVRRRETLKLTVPAAKAAALQAAVEQWLAGKGISASVTSEDAGDGKTHLVAELDEQQSKNLDLSSDAIQDELEKLLTTAAGGHA